MSLYKEVSYRYVNASTLAVECHSIWRAMYIAAHQYDPVARLGLADRAVLEYSNRFKAKPEVAK